MHADANPGLTVAVALAAGMLAQVLASHLRVPGIVLLLLSGVLLGPDVLHLVRPADLGDGLHVLVGLAVAIVLFEGGLNLSWRRLRDEARPIRSLVTWGALVTWTGGAVAAHVFMDWPWRTAILFGALTIVTGPTVVTPLLRRIRVRAGPETVLEAEGVLIDAVGAILAVVALEVVLGPCDDGSVLLGLVAVPWRLLFGAAFGAAGGAALALLLRRRNWVPDGLENAVTLALLLAIHQGSNALHAESGIVSAVAAGLVVGNVPWPLRHELKEFKEQLTVLVIGMLFVLLAADVRVADVVGLGLPGLATVLALVVAVRPLQIALCTLGSSLTWRERAFMAWIAPRGIVAAAVSSVFAERLAAAGETGGDDLRSLVFLLIAVTVVVQGATAGWVASLLGVRRPAGRGWVILGANPLALALGRLLGDRDDIVVVDANADACREAREAGFTAVHGKAEEEDARRAADVESRRGAIAALTNEAVNLLFVQQARRDHRLRRLFVGNQTGHGVLDAATIHAAGAGVLFGRQADLEDWSHRLRHGLAEVQTWRLDDPDRGGAETPPLEAAERLLPLVLLRDGRPEPFDDRVRLAAGDAVAWLVGRDQAAAAAGWLAGHGWRRDVVTRTSP